MGKTTVIATFTVAMMANKAIKKVYGSGPTHISVDNFAERIFQISSHIAERYNSGKLEDDTTRTRRHLVVRGYRLDHEVEAFLNILSSGVASNAAKPKGFFGSPSRWALGLSVAFWLLVVLGSKTVRPLHHDDSTTLHDIRSILMERKSPEIGRLRQLVAGQMSFDEYRKGATLAKDDIKKIMATIISAADVVLTTPGSIIGEYRQFWSRAKGIAIDEAGCLNRADLYHVWGNTLRPCALAGDIKQLPPAVMELIEKDAEGNSLNRFASNGRTSALGFLQASGFPTYRLKTQLRMCRGMFDHAAELVYKELGRRQYGSNCATDNPKFAAGVALEKWLQAAHPEALTAPDKGSLTPVWIDTRGTYCWTDPITQSRKNTKQCDMALTLLADFVRATGVDISSVVIIAPYKLNVDYINTRISRGRYPTLAKISEAATVDSYQGKEGDIVFLVLGTTQKSGPGFTANDHRLNVMITRQRCGLLIFGELSVVGKIGKKESKDRKAADELAKKGVAVVGEDGELHFTKTKMLRELAIRLWDGGRVLVLSASKVLAAKED